MTYVLRLYIAHNFLRTVNFWNFLNSSSSHFPEDCSTEPATVHLHLHLQRTQPFCKQASLLRTKIASHL